MTATDAAVVTGVTEEQLTALVEGRWRDAPGVSDDDGMPGWDRDLDGDGGSVHQWIFPFLSYFVSGVRWSANSNAESGGGNVFVNSLDEALSWCDERAAGRKSDEEGSATKQENLFAQMLADG